MRVKLIFEVPLPQYKCWYEVPSSCSTIRDLQKSIRKGFNLNRYCKTTRLDLDGFFLLPSSTIAGSLKDGDLLQVMIRKKGDNLPPRTLPVGGSKKRTSEISGLHQGTQGKSKRAKTNLLKPASTLNGQASMPKKNEAGNQGNKPKTVNIKVGANKQGAPKNPQTKKSKQVQPNAISQKRQTSGSSNNNSQQKDGSATTAAAKSGTTASSSKRANKRRNRKAAPAAKPKSASPPSSSSSDSSDSSSSDSSSDDDSDDDSNDSSSSDSDSSNNSTDSSSEDSDHVAKATATSKTPATTTSTSSVPATKTPFGCGNPSTKLRNLRRKRLKEAAALAQKQSTENQSVQAPTIPTQDKKITPGVISQPLPSAIPPKESPVQSAPKVIMTTVELKDDGFASRASRPAPAKRVTRSSQKAAATVQHKDKKEVNDTKVEPIVPTNEDSADNEPDLDIPPRNYEELPRIEGNPKVGDLIAYKTLEMSSSYTPIISEFKEATITAFSEADMIAVAQLGRKFRVQFEVDSNGNEILGKFDIYDESEIDRAKRGIVSLDILSLADCRIISSK